MREEKDGDPCMLVYLWDRERIIDSQIIIPFIDMKSSVGEHWAKAELPGHWHSHDGLANVCYCLALEI